MNHWKCAAGEETVYEQKWDKKTSDYVSVERFDGPKFVKAFVQRTELDMLRFVCEEALDCMRAIYKVCFHEVGDESSH